MEVSFSPFKPGNLSMPVFTSIQETLTLNFFYFSIKTMQHLSCQLFLFSFSLAKKHLSCRFFGFLLNSCQYFGSFCNNKNCFMYRFLLLLLKVYLFLFYSLKETQSSKFVIIASNCFFFLLLFRSNIKGDKGKDFKNGPSKA